MTMNKFYFNEHKQDTLKCDWLIYHIISITNKEEYILVAVDYVSKWVEAIDNMLFMHVIT